MASRKPLVLGADGLPQQLQAGDTLNATVSPNTVRSVTNGESSAAIVRCAPVYTSAANTVKKGQANAKTTSTIIGLGYDATIAAAATGNIITDGVMVATTAEWDAVTGATGGLTFNTLYFLDPNTAGMLTSTVPTTTGHCETVIGVALSTTELSLQIELPILL